MKVRDEEIHQVVCRIPRGRVATYGQIAALAGIPGQARRVGYALSALARDTSVPWQRVVNAKGEISLRSDPRAQQLQMQLLRKEGIGFDRDRRIPLARFQWRIQSVA